MKKIAYFTINNKTTNINVKKIMDSMYDCYTINELLEVCLDYATKKLYGKNKTFFLDKNIKLYGSVYTILKNSYSQYMNKADIKTNFYEIVGGLK